MSNGTAVNDVVGLVNGNYEKIYGGFSMCTGFSFVHGIRVIYDSTIYLTVLQGSHWRRHTIRKSNSKVLFKSSKNDQKKGFCLLTLFWTLVFLTSPAIIVVW